MNKKKKKKKVGVLQPTKINNPLEQYKEPIVQLSKELLEAQEFVRIHTTKILQHLETLEAMEQSDILTQDLLLLLSSSSTTTTTDDEDTEVKLDSDSKKDDVKSLLDHWRGIISIGSLREIPYDELQDTFDSVTKEIKVIENNNSMMDDEESTEKLREQFMFDTILGSTVNNNRVSSKAASSYAYENDLQDYLNDYEKKFGNRVQGQGVHALLPESIEVLENTTESKIQIIIEDIYDLAEDLKEKLEHTTITTKTLPSSGDDKSSCVDPEFVTTLVDVGLKALLVHGDVREALRKATLQFDTETSEDELILDADLPLNNESPKSSSNNNNNNNKNNLMKSINIRSKIDTPLLVKSVDWIDHFIDAISGYSDELDQYLDSITDNHGSTSVGEIVVEKILEQAGHVGDIDVPGYFQQMKTLLKLSN
ncbi:hypothetical protein FRACYDRAFT_234591 [Fragilariopsis cylindrus CCMP1102]|uniref:Uncharacterized protein n=1 Tax=Fragilariopsis cylindrus CCMP1102 TaxID=635003 RepID=A0A1E7FS15_9STRA|nr:hypothetical protein FRACYDRAFT_234591 [Fragilariopsis cylindrus CCMP1102]|eukprot:OEU20960.1 hypothetical protein FRACYDRAFT_234591 [Fragilariopsis cylindrus CCMP1102]